MFLRKITIFVGFCLLVNQSCAMKRVSYPNKHRLDDFNRLSVKRQKVSKTPLNDAFDSSQFTLLKDLIVDGGDVNEKNSKGSCLLFNVISKWQQIGEKIGNDERLELVDLCIQKKADVNVQTPWNGRSALHLAVINDCVPLIDRLIAAGARVDLLDREKSTPLHLVCGVNGASIVDALVRAHAQIDVRDELGQTPLHCAVSCGHEMATRRLLVHGADHEAKTNEGNMAIDLTKKDEIHALLKDRDAVRKTTIMPWIQQDIFGPQNAVFALRKREVDSKQFLTLPK